MNQEDFVDIVLKDVEHLGYDTYAADDQIGCELDLLQSLAPDKRIIPQEWNVHTPDPRIAIRTFWGMISKGVKGVCCFLNHESLTCREWPKFAFLNGDLTPKKKLGAIADAAHEVHRLEPLLSSARRGHLKTKPVALYYSDIDLSLGTPSSSLWGTGHDCPFHVYETLRGRGYHVRWITPKQIINNELENVSALFLVDSQYIPEKAAVGIETWVRNGGVIIGDRFPGARDEYGRKQTVLSPVFGIKAIQKQKKKDQLEMEEVAAGYGPWAGDAFVPEDITQTITEIYQQWDSNHPLAQELGNFMLSGYGYHPVECVAGEVVGMSHNGKPGIVITQHGKGKSMYVAAFMGTLFDSAATRFEWNMVHSGLSFGKVLEAFLSYAGVHPHTKAYTEPPRLATKLRIEQPLVTDDGNMFVGLTSLNDGPLNEFEIEFEVPEEAGTFGAVYVVTDAGRNLKHVNAKLANNRMKLLMPSFDTHASIIALKQFRPLISIMLKNAEQGHAKLGTVTPDRDIEVIADIFNPTSETLPQGLTQLYLPLGWYMDRDEIGTESIAPWGKATVTFKIRAPGICARTRLRPIIVKYRAGEIKSTPATELIWWTN